MSTNTVETKVKTDYTEGSILSSILKMGLPSMFGFVVQHLYAMTDMFWVSRLPGNESAVAAITFFNNLMWILFAFNSLIGPGSVAVISRRYGEKAYDDAEKAIKETITLKLIFGTFCGIIGWVFIRQLLGLLGASGDALEMGIGYGRVILFGLPIMYATYSIFTALRGIANPRWAMGLMISANILNLTLDPLFIFGYLGFPEMGINGAAVASVISFTTVFIVGLFLFRTDKINVTLHLIGKKSISFLSMWKIVRIGIPAWIGELSFSLSRMMITPIIAGFGTAVVAAYGVAMQLFAFGIMLLVGIGLGLSSLIGHNLGGQKYERAKKTADQSILLGMGIMTTFGILIFFFGKFYMDIFFDAPETVELGYSILKIWLIGFPIFGAWIMLEQIHSGVGLNTPFMIISFVHSWILQVLPAYILVKIFGFDQNAVWWIMGLAGYVSVTSFYIYYRRGRWLTIKV